MVLSVRDTRVPLMLLNVQSNRPSAAYTVGCPTGIGRSHSSMNGSVLADEIERVFAMSLRRSVLLPFTVLLVFLFGHLVQSADTKPSVERVVPTFSLKDSRTHEVVTIENCKD